MVYIDAKYYFLVLTLLALVLLPFVIKAQKSRRRNRFAKYKELGLFQLSEEKFEQWVKPENFFCLNFKFALNRIREPYGGSYRGREIALFTHSVGTGAKPVHQHAVIAALGTKTPQFLLRQEGLVDKLKSLFGGSDINFVNDELFSKKYLLDGKDEARIRGIFDDSLRRVLVLQDKLWMESDGSRLVVYKYGQCPEDGSNLRDLVDLAVEVISIVERNNSTNNTQTS